MTAKYDKVIGWFVILGALAFMPRGAFGQTSPAKPRETAGGKSAGGQGSKLPEDWTKLRVQDTSLRMKQPEPAEKDDIPSTGFIRERYQAQWRPVDPFDLYVIRPRGAQHPPVILYLYSFPEDTDQFKNNMWCEAAVSGGYAAVGFVGAVTGHRARYRLGKEWFVSEMQEALGSTVHDVQLILDYLETRKDLDARHVAMFGSGSGGAIAFMASAADSRIRAVDLLGPWGDWPEWIAGTKIIPDEERAKYQKPEFLAKVASLEPMTWLPKIKAKALRIQDVRVNKSMPDEAQKELEAAAPEIAVLNEYGNGRAFMANQRAGDLFQWMKDRLKEDTQVQAAAAKSKRVHIFPALEAPPAENWPNAAPAGAGKGSAEKKPVPASEKEKPKVDQPH